MTNDTNSYPERVKGVLMTQEMLLAVRDYVEKRSTSFFDRIEKEFQSR